MLREVKSWIISLGFCTFALDLEWLSLHLCCFPYPGLTKLFLEQQWRKCNIPTLS